MVEELAEAAIVLCSSCCCLCCCCCFCPSSPPFFSPAVPPLVVAITNSPAIPPPLFTLTNIGSSPSLKFTSNPLAQPSANPTVALNSLKLNVNFASSKTLYSLKSSVAIFTSVAILFLIVLLPDVVGISSSLLLAIQVVGVQWSEISPEREVEGEEGERK